MLEQPKAFEDLSKGERAEYIPKLWLDHEKEAPAFIFTKENLGKIKRYETAVYALPRDRNALSMTLDFDLVGIDIQQVLDFHDGLRLHVGMWLEVEEACKRMAVRLHVFAVGLIVDGSKLLGAIRETDAWKAAKESNTWDEVDINQVTSAPLSLMDVITVKAAVDNYLQAILRSIKARLNDIQEVSNKINEFINTIRNKLRPQVDRLVVNVANKELAGQLAALEADIAAADARIEELLKQYKTLVGVSFSGALFGPLGLVITGGVFGHMAEKVRAEKNALIAARSRHSAQRAAVLEQVGSFQDFKGVINDLQFRLVDVQMAAKNLKDVWGVLEVYAESSIEQLDYVDTNVALLTFSSGFERVIAPWSQIRGFSEKVSNLFNETVG